MLHFVTFPMHFRDGHIVTLRAILDNFSTNDLLWRILHFTGVGKAPDGLTMLVFEQIVRESPDGYRLTWSELLAFASEIEQVWDCLIVASKPQDQFYRNNLEADKFVDCYYVVDGFDSTEWKIGTKQELNFNNIF